ncbi:MAG: hypothetical protein QW076_05055 [Candidatus Anstonellales archaeon]
MNEQTNSVRTKKNPHFAARFPIVDNPKYMSSIIFNSLKALKELPLSNDNSCPIKNENDFNDKEKLNAFLHWLIIYSEQKNLVSSTLLNNIIELGADVNNRLNNPKISDTFLGYCPLHIACALNKEIYAKTLLARNANPNTSVNDRKYRIYGITPLFISLQNNHVLATQLVFFKDNSAKISNLKYVTSDDEKTKNYIRESIVRGLDETFLELALTKNEKYLLYIGLERLNDLKDVYLYFHEYDKALIIQELISLIKATSSKNLQ